MNEPDLTVRKVRGMGRGVFAGRAFAAREVIEVCPVIRLPTAEAFPGLEDYVYLWGDDAAETAVALGYGSLYNHSATANAEFIPKFKRSEIVFRALRAIAAGEQIFINYQWEPDEYAAYFKPRRAVD